jgi:hypothetical protein
LRPAHRSSGRVSVEGSPRDGRFPLGSRRQGQSDRRAPQELTEEIQGRAPLLPTGPPHRPPDRLRPRCRPGPAATPDRAQDDPKRIANSARHPCRSTNGRFALGHGRTRVSVADEARKIAWPLPISAQRLHSLYSPPRLILTGYGSPSRLDHGNPFPSFLICPSSEIPTWHQEWCSHLSNPLR